MRLNNEEEGLGYIVSESCIVNGPLNIKQLQKRDGLPVYVRYSNGEGEYGLVETMMGLEHIKIYFKYGMKDVKNLFANGTQFFCFNPQRRGNK